MTRRRTNAYISLEGRGGKVIARVKSRPPVEEAAGKGRRQSGREKRLRLTLLNTHLHLAKEHSSIWFSILYTGVPALYVCTVPS